MNSQLFIVVALRLALCHASDPTHEIMAERISKAAVAASIPKKTSVAASPKKVSFSQREAEKTSMLIQTAADEAKDAVKDATARISAGEELEKKANEIDISWQGHMSKDIAKDIKKMDWEVSFLQQEMISAVRQRDHSFAQKEISKIVADKEKTTKMVQEKVAMATQKKHEMEQKGRAMRSKAEADLDHAQHVFVGIEALGQSVEEWNSKVPSFMVQSLLEQARKSVAQQQMEALQQQELNSKKRALWQIQGKELTCDPGIPAIQTFLLDSKKDDSANVECLQKQLSKYCLSQLRAPAMNIKQALQLVGVKDDCLPKGIDSRVPAKNRGAVGAKWCTVVSILQSVITQAKKSPYFLMLEDDISVDHKEFEETVSSFAQTYREEPWDMLQIDPFGTHSERDEDMAPHFKGFPVFRNSRHGQYYGFHTVLMKTASAPKILEKMMSMPAVPLDTLPTLLNEAACDVGGCRQSQPSALSLQAFITETPKADQMASALVERARVPKACWTEVPHGLSELEASSWSSLVQILSKPSGGVNSAPQPRKKVKTLARGFG